MTTKEQDKRRMKEEFYCSVRGLWQAIAGMADSRKEAKRVFLNTVWDIAQAKQYCPHYAIHSLTKAYEKYETAIEENNE